MTTVPKNNNATDEAANGKELECSKCGLLNPAHAHHCKNCGAHLVVRCHNCGQRNERTAAHCAHCGHRMHRSLWRKWHKRMFLKNYEFAPWHAVALVLFVALAFYVIVRIAESKFRWWF